MKILIALIFCCCAFPQQVRAAWTEGNRRIEAEQVALWENKLIEAKNKPTTERPAELWLGLRNMGYRKTSEGHSPAVDAIYGKLQEELLSIPGHAEYFEKQIKDLQSKVENATKDEKSNYRTDYDDIQKYGFQTLEQLPSPETVRVLGDFLADGKGGIDYAEVGPNPTEGQIMSQQKKNCNLAALTLYKLIANPPMEDVGWLKPDAVKAWLEWYEQVKAGGRTFRFKGNPMEYDLNGPAPKEKLERNERALKRDEERNAGHKKDTSFVSDSITSNAYAPKALPIAGILAACALIAGAVWYYLRGRRTV